MLFYNLMFVDTDRYHYVGLFVIPIAKELLLLFLLKVRSTFYFQIIQLQLINLFGARISTFIEWS